LWTDWPTNRFNRFSHVQQAVETACRHAALRAGLKIHRIESSSSSSSSSCSKKPAKTDDEDEHEYEAEESVSGFSDTLLGVTMPRRLQIGDAAD
jgi:hypothetical protein